MDYHNIGVTICNTVDKCCPTNLTEEQRTALISAVAVWLDKQQAKGREAGLREAAKVAEGHGGGVITKALAVDIRDAILAAIVEGHD